MKHINITPDGSLKSRQYGSRHREAARESWQVEGVLHFNTWMMEEQEKYP